MHRYAAPRRKVDTELPPGVFHRYTRYVAKTKGMKFTPVAGMPKTWTHVQYLNGDLVCRERMDQTEVDIAITLHDADGHFIRSSDMPEVVQMYEVHEGA